MCERYTKNELPIVIIGAGRCALTTACRLSKEEREKVIVVDETAGTWLGKFASKMQAWEMPVLRETRNVHFHTDALRLTNWAARTISGSKPLDSMGPSRESEFITSSKDVVPLATPKLCVRQTAPTSRAYCKSALSSRRGAHVTQPASVQVLRLRRLGHSKRFSRAGA